MKLTSRYSAYCGFIVRRDTDMQRDIRVWQVGRGGTIKQFTSIVRGGVRCTVVIETVLSHVIVFFFLGFSG